MNNTSEYLLLIRGTNWHQGLSPQELEETLGRFMAWIEGLQAKGIVKAATPLASEGKVVSGANGSSVLDGPFAESKEAIGGYILLTAEDLDEAVAIAGTSPMLAYGCAMEARPVAQECPHAAMVREAKVELVHA